MKVWEQLSPETAVTMYGVERATAIRPDYTFYGRYMPEEVRRFVWDEMRLLVVIMMLTDGIRLYLLTIDPELIESDYPENPLESPLTRYITLQQPAVLELADILTQIAPEAETSSPVFQEVSAADLLARGFKCRPFSDATHTYYLNERALADISISRNSMHLELYRLPAQPNPDTPPDPYCTGHIDLTYPAIRAFAALLKHQAGALNA